VLKSVSARLSGERFFRPDLCARQFARANRPQKKIRQ
jgi:hypothetical protein